MSKIDYEKLNRDFLHVYTKRIELKKMLKFKLRKNLDEIVSDNSSLEDLVFELINWAEENGKLDQLIEGAYRYKPENHCLKPYYDSIQHIPDLSQDSILSDDYQDRLQTILSLIEFNLLRQICKNTLGMITQDPTQEMTQVNNIESILEMLLNKFPLRNDRVPTILGFTQRLCDFDILGEDELPQKLLNFWLKDITQEKGIDLPIQYEKLVKDNNEEDERIDSYLFIIINEIEEMQQFSLSAELIPHFEEGNKNNQSVPVELEDAALDTCNLNELTPRISQSIEIARRKLILEYKYTKHNLILELFIPFGYLKESIDLQAITASGNQSKPLGSEFFLAIRCSNRYELDSFSNFGEFIVKLEKKWEVLQRIIQEKTDEQLKESFTNISLIEDKFNWDAMVDKWEKEEKVCINLTCALPKDGNEQNFFLYILKGGIPISLWNRSSKIPFQNAEAEFNQILNLSSLKDLFQLYQGIRDIRRRTLTSSKNENIMLSSIGFLCDHPWRLPSELNYHLGRDRF